MSTDLRQQLQSTLGSAYTLDRELGGGGMSRVFVAEDTVLRRKVVVKVLSPDLAAGVNVERFQREIHLAATLQHPHIVPVLAAGETDGLPYYTMPFVEGESLRAWLGREGRLSIPDGVGVLRDMAKALAFAHEHGIVHRDIKPENVLVTRGSAAVADFGIAKAISAARTPQSGATLTQTGTSIGTPAYMAPEQAAGDPATDHRADLYSFGCVAYELLAGRPPFTEQNPRKLLAAHLSTPPAAIAELRPEIPAVLARLVMQCLEKDADQRPPEATDLTRVLAGLTIGDPTGDTSPAAVLLGGAGTFRKALAVYAVALVAVSGAARVAITGIGLPEWVLPGALLVMALVLPAVLWTGYAHWVARRAATVTPTYTPGGKPSVTHGPLATMALKAHPRLSWRRATWGAVVALAGFVLFVAGYMTLRAMGIGPFGTLLAAGALPSNPLVLVAHFRTPTDTALGVTLADNVRSMLSASGAVRTLTPQQVATELRLMDRPPDARLDAATARDIAARTGVAAIVEGEVKGVGAGFLVTLRLITAARDSEVFFDKEFARDENRLIDAIDALTRSLRGKIGESLKSVQATPALSRAMTSSLEALRWYTDGMRAQNAEGNFAKAVANHRKAVAADSTFAEAWRALGAQLNNIGAAQSLRDSALGQAYRYRERRDARAQRFIAGSYFGVGRPWRDRGRAIAIMQAGLDGGTAADSITFRSNLGLWLIYRRDFAAAEGMLWASIRGAPRAAMSRDNLILGLIVQGKLDSADSLATAGLTDARAASALWHLNLIRVRYARGDVSGAAKALDSLPAGGPDVARTRIGIAAVQGRLAAARRLNAQRSAQLSALLSSAGALTPSLADSVTVGIFDVIAERGKAAASRLDGAIAARLLRASAPVDRPYLDMARLYALAGRPARAREILRQRLTEVTDTALLRAGTPWQHRALGEILIAEGRGREAIAEFWRSDSLPDGPSSESPRSVYAEVGRAHDAAGASDSAVFYLERYLATPAGGWWMELIEPDPLFLAPAHERLGQLYEARGDVAKAAEHYRAFVDLWQHADPELQPRVRAARLRLSQLARAEKP